MSRRKYDPSSRPAGPLTPEELWALETLHPMARSNLCRIHPYVWLCTYYSALILPQAGSELAALVDAKIAELNGRL